MSLDYKRSYEHYMLWVDLANQYLARGDYYMFDRVIAYLETYTTSDKTTN